MIVDNFYTLGVAVMPLEADAPLSVDTNAVLTPAASRQLLQMVARRDAQVRQGFRGVEDFELSTRGALNLRWQPARRLPAKESFRILVGKAPNHVFIVTCGVNPVKRYYWDKS
jgi:hypothetical protein